MDYERKKYWKEQAKEDPSEVLGFIAASHESLVENIKKHKRAVYLAFVVVAALIFSLHGFESSAGAVARIFK